MSRTVWTYVYTGQCCTRIKNFCELRWCILNLIVNICCLYSGSDFHLYSEHRSYCTVERLILRWAKSVEKREAQCDFQALKEILTSGPNYVRNMETSFLEQCAIIILFISCTSSARFDKTSNENILIFSRSRNWAKSSNISRTFRPTFRNKLTDSHYSISFLVLLVLFW